MSSVSIVMIMQRLTTSCLAMVYSLSQITTIRSDPEQLFFPQVGVEHRTINTGLKSLRFLYVFPADLFEQIDYKFTEL